MTILAGIIILWVGILIGFMLHLLIANTFRKYSGTLVVRQDEGRDKIVYSLVLDDYPEKLAFEKVVVLKVEPSEESLDRM